MADNRTGAPGFADTVRLDSVQLRQGHDRVTLLARETCCQLTVSRIIAKQAQDHLGRRYRLTLEPVED